MADFEYFEQRSRATVAKRLELRRNPMKAPGMRNSQEAVLGFLIRKCHEVHRAAKEPCGPVCEAYPYALPPDWPAQIQEAHLGGVLAAMNGKHDIAVKLIGKALAQAETLLATKDHHLGGLLWQYAIALNAVGRRKEARRLRERSKRMDRRAASRGFPL
jgi:hypothetical protein